MGGLIISKGLVVEQSSKGVRKPIQLDFRRFGQYGGAHVTELTEWKKIKEQAIIQHDYLMKGNGDLLKDGPVVMTGWKTESPFVHPDFLANISTHANKLASEVDCFWSGGIGGSYLGNRAAIEAVRGPLLLFNNLSLKERNGTPQIFFIGQNMDPIYMKMALQIMRDKKVAGNIISKSGGTVEPAIAFAIIKSLMENSYSPDEVANQIIAITDKQKGALKQLATQKGYATYDVPDNVGGRYSVTSPVGLFSLAVGGLNIDEFIAGARDAEIQTRNQPFDSNIAMLRASMRFAAHKTWDKKIEVASTGVNSLISSTQWFVQLGPESEGKNGEGLFVTPEYYTEQAHANGQMIKSGERNLIETFLMLEKPDADVIIPGMGTPVEYLNGKTLHFANTSFVEGLRDDHYLSGVPTMSYIFPVLNEYTLGMYFQFEMNAIAISGLMLGQNPFIQPGVQGYKKLADAKSGKPGTEAFLAELQSLEAALNPRHVI